MSDRGIAEEEAQSWRRQSNVKWSGENYEVIVVYEVMFQESTAISGVSDGAYLHDQDCKVQDVESEQCTKRISQISEEYQQAQSMVQEKLPTLIREL